MQHTKITTCVGARGHHSGHHKAACHSRPCLLPGHRSHPARGSHPARRRQDCSKHTPDRPCAESQPETDRRHQRPSGKQAQPPAVDERPQARRWMGTRGLTLAQVAGPFPCQLCRASLSVIVIVIIPSEPLGRRRGAAEAVGRALAPPPPPVTAAVHPWQRHSSSFRSSSGLRPCAPCGPPRSGSCGSKGGREGSAPQAGAGDPQGPASPPKKHCWARRGERVGGAAPM